jgi:glycine betaine catabolism B
MLSRVDRFLNGITMYQLVLYVLFSLAAVAIILASFGLVSQSPIGMVISLLILTITCYYANQLLARAFGAPTNPESAPITALILFFIMAPASTYLDGAIALFAGAIAMASKYLIARGRQHIVNPAAFGAIVAGIPTGAALWWVGTPYMLPFTLVAGFLIARKIRRIQMVLATIGAGLVTFTAYGAFAGSAPLDAAQNFFLSWPIIFFASIMVTEPITAPGTKRSQLLYGSLIGVFSSLPLHVGAIYSTPELTLAVANVASFTRGLKRRLVLTLREVHKVARETYEFSFAKPESVTYAPGQYLEWTLQHEKPDSRGIRRFFTVASSPTEEDLKIGVRIAEQRSSFKGALRSLKPGDRIVAGVRAGSFTLPENRDEKLAFIAGGIGVTPFRSMVRHLIDTEQERDVVLFYACRTHQDAAYTELFAEAGKAFGMRTTYVFSDDADGAPEGSEKGFIDGGMLARITPDFKDRTFYLSGPDAMVQAYKKLLRAEGVSASRIRTDYFPGF